MDIFNTQIQKRQKHDDRFLLIPCDIVDDGQIVDVIKSENFL